MQVSAETLRMVRPVPDTDLPRDVTGWHSDRVYERPQRLVLKTLRLQYRPGALAQPPKTPARER